MKKGNYDHLTIIQVTRSTKDINTFLTTTYKAVANQDAVKYQKFLSVGSFYRMIAKNVINFCLIIIIFLNYLNKLRPVIYYEPYFYNSRKHCTLHSQARSGENVAVHCHSFILLYRKKYLQFCINQHLKFNMNDNYCWLSETKSC